MNRVRKPRRMIAVVAVSTLAFAALALVEQFRPASPATHAAREGGARAGFIPAFLFAGCDTGGCNTGGCGGSGSICDAVDEVGKRLPFLNGLLDFFNRIFKSGDGSCSEYCNMEILYTGLEPGGLPGPVCPCTNTENNRPGAILYGNNGGQSRVLFNGSYSVSPSGSSGPLRLTECIPATGINIDPSLSVPYGTILVNSGLCPPGQCERFIPLWNASTKAAIDNANCTINISVPCRASGMCVPCE